MASMGDVYRVRKGQLPTDDPKESRRYVLMTPDHGPDQPYVSISYASGSLDASEKAASVLVEPRPFGPDANGFDEDTLVFPGLLFPFQRGRLGVSLGRLSASERAAVRAAAPGALGCSSGSCRPGAGKPNRPGLRGVIIRFADWVQEKWPTLRYAVVLTPLPYAVRESAFHAVVPIDLDASRVDAPDFFLPTPDWAAQLGSPSANRVAAAVTDTMMAKLENFRPAPGGVACSDSEMALIDSALLSWLGIPQRQATPVLRAD